MHREDIDVIDLGQPVHQPIERGMSLGGKQNQLIDEPIIGIIFLVEVGSEEECYRPVVNATDDAAGNTKPTVNESIPS